MAFLATDELLNKFNFKLDDPTGYEQIEFAQESAKADLEDWLSEADFALLSSTEELSAEDAKKVKRIVRAHAYLTVYYIFLNNTQIRASGTTETERGADDNSTIKYFKPKEIEEFRAMYLTQAKNSIAAFAKVNFFETVETAQFSSYAVYTPKIKC